MAEVCRFDEHAGECRWKECPNLVPGSPTGCPLPWPKADTPIRKQSALELLETHAKALEAENERLRFGLEEIAHVIGNNYNRCWMRVKARETLRGEAESRDG